MDKLPDIQTEPDVESSLKPDDELDPRVPIEFERLNYANEAINNLELQLDDARKSLKELCEISQEELAQLERTIGTAVSKARSYYEARIKLREAKEILIKAKHRFERAQALHVAAKELALVSADYVDEAEESSPNATAWSETYRQALAKAGDAEREKYLADYEQQHAEQVCFEMDMLVEKLERDSRRSINKSKPYYEKKVEFNKELDFHKRKVSALENCVNEAKSQYHESLKNLERISNEIHRQRNGETVQSELEERTPGVGEEHITPTETRPAVSQPMTTTSPTISQPNNASDTLLRSCLLRTETLPAGVFTNPNNRYPPEGNEATVRTSEYNNQFILRSQPAPQPTLVNNFTEESNTFGDDIRDRVSSFSSQASQMTDGSDDNRRSLHALSDEQLDHLSSAYYPFSSELSSETGMRSVSSEQRNNTLSDSMLY